MSLCFGTSFGEFLFIELWSNSMIKCLAHNQLKMIPKNVKNHSNCASGITSISHQDCSKSMTSLFHQFCYEGTKSQSTQLGLHKIQPRSIPFATNVFRPHFAYICDNYPPRFLKNHDFTFSPILLPSHKKPIHPTWLRHNPTKINSFCNQTFHTSFCIHFWHFPTKIAQKLWLHFFSNFATKAQKLGKRPNMAKPKSNQDQFHVKKHAKWYIKG